MSLSISVSLCPPPPWFRLTMLKDAAVSVYFMQVLICPAPTFLSKLTLLANSEGHHAAPGHGCLLSMTQTARYVTYKSLRGHQVYIVSFQCVCLRMPVDCMCRPARISTLHQDRIWSSCIRLHGFWIFGTTRGSLLMVKWSVSQPQFGPMQHLCR